MKFLVREGFVVHDTKFVTVKQNGQDVKQEQTNTHYEGQTVDFDSVSALEHLHKLQPADKEAEKFAASLVLESAAPGAVLDHSTAITALAEQISALTALVANMGGVSAPAIS
jgi:hypothetical protein